MNAPCRVPVGKLRQGVKEFTYIHTKPDREEKRRHQHLEDSDGSGSKKAKKL